MWIDITRAKHARKGLRYSNDMTDAEWAFLEPHFPPRSGLGRPPKWSRRTITNGVFYVLRSGLPWRMDTYYEVIDQLRDLPVPG
jgi:hypothetical protein